MAKENKLIQRLPEGKLRNAQIRMEIDGKELKGCACCICAPNVRGAGDETAKQSGTKLADDVMMVVIGTAIKP